MKRPPSSLPGDLATPVTILDDEDYPPPPVRKTRKAPPPRSRSETERTEDVLTWMNSQPGTFAMKKHTGAYGQGGHPDIFACRNSRMVLVEMKVPGEVPDARQMQRLRTWRAAGAAVCWADGVGHVKELFDRIDSDPDWINPLTGPGAP